MNKINDETIYFAKLKEDAIIPSKNEEDGCYDVYANFETETVTIMPLEIKLISTGISSACSPKYRFGLRERGSSGTKGLSYVAGQIDSGYRGEWFVPINNTSNKTIVITKNPEYLKEELKRILNVDIDKFFTIYPYTKAIVQVALENVPDVKVETISIEQLKAIPSIRGNGMLGSSNK